MELLTNTLAGFTAMSGWEYIAVFLGIAYLLLAIKQNQWCWFAAFFSTLIYTILYFNGALLMESLLNVYYMAMAIYGWWAWQYGSPQHNTLAISSWSWQRHITIIALTTCIALAIGYLMDTRTHADYAYLDSLTSCFAVMTTYLVAKKVLENWLYWVVIDAASLYLYFVKGYYPTFVLFVFYTFMAMWGYYTWRKQYQQVSLSSH